MSEDSESSRCVVGVTMGDACGIGPELIVRAWHREDLHALCRPVVIGQPDVLRRFLPHGSNLRIDVTAESWPEPSPSRIPCISVGAPSLAELPLGVVHAEAARAAYDCLCVGIDLARAGRIDALVTMPLNKEGLHAAGLDYPGHTEILAERTGTAAYGMMLYRNGLGVVHVTLHEALREVFGHITTEAIQEKIVLIDAMMRRLGAARPRLGVAALNPHASDGGRFGTEEARIISPAVEWSKREGMCVAGPLPADTLFVRAAAGEFDGVVAMYHDQGHIALKLLGWREAVNITVGLPMIRTSVAHGTGYDIVGKGLADPASFMEATRIACQLANTRKLEPAQA